MSLDSFFGKPLEVINLGLDMVAADLRDSGVPVVHVDWKPPAGGNARLAGILSRLEGLGRRGVGEDKGKEG